MSDLGNQIRDLKERTETNRREFLRAELQTCALAIERARLELSFGNRGEAEKEIAIASRGTEVIEKFLGDARQIPAIETGLMKLKAALESLRAEMDANLR